MCMGGKKASAPLPAPTAPADPPNQNNASADNNNAAAAQKQAVVATLANTEGGAAPATLGKPTLGA
jgi:hypothetical protein